ncbi:hypothetical protein [Stenotrophomonas maltophilia]
MELPFEVGALYNRQKQIHGVFGGQQQSGISTPKQHPVVIAFTGKVGVSHGYHDFWDDAEVFHYFGEGQVGDMKYVAGDRTIGEHIKDDETLAVFQIMGKGGPTDTLVGSCASPPTFNLARQIEKGSQGLRSCSA